MNCCCTPESFEILLSEKRESERETEYLLPEYLPNIGTVIKGEASVKINDKTVGDGSVSVNCEIVYNVLYACERDGTLKSVVFSDNFNTYFELPDSASTDSEVYILSNGYAVNDSVKAAGQRRIAARSRVCISCEVLSANGASNIECENDQNASEDSKDTEIPKNTENECCNVQLLKSKAEFCKLCVSEEATHTLNESITLNDEMPEPSNVLLCDATCCVKEIETSLQSATLTGTVTFSCLYESCGDEKNEYIRFTEEIPFTLDCPLPECENMEKALDVTNLLSETRVLSVSAELDGDSYGEQRIFSVNIELSAKLFSFHNEEAEICKDLYSTDGECVPLRKSIQRFSFAGVFGGLLFSEEKLRVELRGITELIYTKPSLIFGFPEFSDGKWFIPAHGNISVLGLRENGEIESTRANVKIKIPTDDIPPTLSQSKLKWLNETALCKHECEISGGELSLRLWAREALAAFRDESTELVCGFTPSEKRNGVKKKSGFTLYYPSSDESVWSVAKAHAVSYERLKNENDVGEAFEDGKMILLR